RSGTYGPVSAQPQNPGELPPFGANLFGGGLRGAMGDGWNASYQVKPGDQITVRAWGAFEFERVLPVDAQGNIFIPGSGPLNV
ncbi:polysaccharide biosynthesis/export family protein, partial [Pantoea sp. SIMBA_133]